MANKEILLANIRKAMQGELDSVTLYANAATHCDDPEVRNFFETRRREEQVHFNYLLGYYNELTAECEPTRYSLENLHTNKLHDIFSDEFIKRIGSDQILFTAISTALLLEKDAFQHYAQLSASADNITLRSFFSLLENWEKQHYDELLAIQKEAEIYFWEQNEFQPF